MTCSQRLSARSDTRQGSGVTLPCRSQALGSGQCHLTGLRFDFMLLCFTPGTGPKPPLSSGP
jgi:hypothetical protein